jgi:hypothetical protein
MTQDKLANLEKGKEHDHVGDGGSPLETEENPQSRRQISQGDGLYPSGKQTKSTRETDSIMGAERFCWEIRPAFRERERKTYFLKTSL